MAKPGIILTERAANHVKQFLQQQSKTTVLRFAVKPTGCSGYAYVVQPAVQPADTDETFISNGVTIVVDKQSLNLVQGTEIDYVREGINESFKFNNPNVKNTCGCGESFNV